MEFIKTMKKREFIEMGLKTLAAILAAFLAIILMEGMIYSIELHALKTKSKNILTVSNQTILYCIEESEDQYFVIAYNEENKNPWSARSNDNLKTRAELEAMVGDTVKEVKFRAPTAFEFSITGVHYVVMAVFVAAVAGFFVYKFIALSKEYNKIETTFKKTGTIELG